MARYTRRADGRYMTHVKIGFQDNGKLKRKTVYAHTIRQLEEKIAEVRRQLREGTLVADEKVTVSKWADEWLDTYKNNVEYNTRLMYNVMVNTHIKPGIGQLRLKDVRPHHLQKLVNDKLADGSLRTAQKIALTLKQIFKKAVENDLLSKNPADTIELPKREKPKKRALSEAEKGYIERADLDLKSRAYVYVLLYAGLRKSEALALMTRDIDLREKTITVSRSLITKGNTPEIKPSPKSDAGNRTIPMPDILVGVLASYMKTLKTLYLFPSASNAIMSKSAFRCFWDKITRRVNAAAGGDSKLKVLASDITPHIFRHTYATMLYYAGVDAKAAQYLLGHSSISMTMEVYTHLDPHKTQNAAEKLNNLIRCSQKVVL